MEYRIVLFLPLLVMLTSGCTIPDFLGGGFVVNQPEGLGVVVEDFTTDFSEVYSGEDVMFSLKVRNTGSQKATGAFAELLGLDQTWRGYEGSRINPSNQEVFPQETECRYTNQEINLLPPNQASGVSGEDYICTWKHVAPPIQAGLHADYKPRARFFYNYESITAKTVTLIPREDLKIYQDQGKTLPADTDSMTGSPIQLDMEIRSPIRTIGTGVEFPVIIRITNVGGGTVCSDANNCKKYPYDMENQQPTAAGASWNEFKIEMDLGQGLSFQTCQQTMDVYLTNGKEQIISCKLRANVPDSISQRQVILKAKYGYFIDTETNLRVTSNPIPGGNA